MSRARFLYNFLVKPRQVGSVTPSSRRLCRRLLKAADISGSDCVVEFGPGTACLTRLLIDELPEGARLVAFEINDDFVRELRKEISHPGVALIHDGAERVKEYLTDLGYEGADYIFSGLPFSTIPADLRERILRASYSALKPGGKFIAYQYSLFLLKKLRAIFDDVRVDFEPLNFPPAFCFVCAKKTSRRQE